MARMLRLHSTYGYDRLRSTESRARSFDRLRSAWFALLDLSGGAVRDTRTLLGGPEEDALAIGADWQSIGATITRSVERYRVPERQGNSEAHASPYAPTRR